MPSNATILYPGQIDSTSAATNPAEYPVRYLAEGDSWFSFGSWKLHSMLTQMRLERPTALVTLAQPGDTIRRMSDISRNVALDNWLSEPFGAYRWNALLISGGGNDVIDDAHEIIPPRATAAPAGPASSYVDFDRLEQTLAEVREGYRRIVAMRDRDSSPCQGVPLVTHAYDFATPRDAPARFLVFQLGPWLHPAMVAAKVPPAARNEVSDIILAALGECIIELENELPNFHVARTQGVLRRAAPNSSGESNDWANEIHPSGHGFRRLAALLAEILEALT